MSIKHFKSLGKHTGGQVRTEGPYTNTFRASAPAWTLNEMVNYRTDDSYYANGINMRWPLDMARDALLVYLNPNDDQSACEVKDNGGFDNAGLDSLANGYNSNQKDARTLNYFQDNSAVVDRSDYIFTRRWRFCERVFHDGKNAVTPMVTDTLANNARYIYYSDYNGNNSEYGSIPCPFVFDTTLMSSRTGNDRVKNLTMQIFVKLTRNDAGPFMKTGWYTGNYVPDGYSFGVSAGQASSSTNGNAAITGGSNIYSAGVGTRLVVRYPHIRNFTSSLYLTLNQWHMVTLVINNDFSPTLYLDDGGTGKSWTGASNYIPLYPNTWMNFAMNNGDITANRFIQESIQMGQGITLCYAKALSQTEVEQNWNTFKGFYGL